MIQDIAPHRYSNAYTPLPPRPRDCVLYYEPHKTLLRRHKDQIVFPTFEELNSHNQGIQNEATFLFAIDDCRFYLADHVDPVPLSGFTLENTEVFRLADPQHLAFAGITGYQLYQWYHSRRFCGCCGSPPPISRSTPPPR